MQRGILLGIQLYEEQVYEQQRCRSTDVQDVIAAQFSCQDAWAKRSVSANIDTPEEDNKGHTRIMKKKTKVRYSSVLVFSQETACEISST